MANETMPDDCQLNSRSLLGAAVLVAALLLSSRADAFWVVNFGTAEPLPPAKIGFAAGIGGQTVFVGDPTSANAFFLIPHAGLRLGLVERLDVGFRLAPVPLPFSTVGPGFGANIDLKFLLTRPGATVGFSAIVGAGGAHVLVLDDHKAAYSPNGALLLSFKPSDTTTLTTMARYVYLAMPTAPGGGSDNHVHIAGPSVGLKFQVSEAVSLLPEVGAYWYEGRIAATRMAGPGFQYGVMLATAF